MQFESHSVNEYAFKELSSLTGIKPYVLRFWESEFEQIAPTMSADGRKVYSEEDKQSIETIKELLFGQKLSIQEAKAELDRALSEAVNQLKEEMNLEVAIEAPVESPVEVNLSVAVEESKLAEVKSADIKSIASVKNNQVKNAENFEPRSAFAFESSLEMMQQSLGEDIKQASLKNSMAIDYSEKDMLALLQAKRKLKIHLNKIDDLYQKYGW